MVPPWSRGPLGRPPAFASVIARGEGTLAACRVPESEDEAMSSVVTSGASKQVSAQALAASNVRPGLAGVIDRLGVANVALAGVTLLSFGALFFRWMNNQFGPEGFSWKFTEDWGHAYVVPLISGYYIWKRREWFARQTVQIFWPGAAVLLLGIVCYPYFIIGFSNHMFQGFALI